MQKLRKQGYIPFARSRKELLDEACEAQDRYGAHRCIKRDIVDIYKGIKGLGTEIGEPDTAIWHEWRRYGYPNAFFRARKKFIRLRDEWRAQRGHEPSTMKAVMLPAYQKIIGMGPMAVPFLLRELKKNLDNWFWALMAITEENPVPEEAQGNGEAMAQAWLQWAKERGYEW